MTRLSRRLLALTMALCLVGGCASSPGGATGNGLDDRPLLGEEFTVHDPWERWNRGIYNWNASIDKHVLIPIVDGYTFVVPEVFRNSITNFFQNIENIRIFANQVLQLKFAEAGQTAVRFAFNTGMGLLGIADIATALGMPQYDEDFGQTLGYWGTDAGPYLVLPLYGPSNVRDTGGLAVDTYSFTLVDPFNIWSLYLNRPPVLMVDILDERYTQPFRYYATGSPFEYEVVRLLYTKKRQLDIQR